MARRLFLQARYEKVRGLVRATVVGTQIEAIGTTREAARDNLFQSLFETFGAKTDGDVEKLAVVIPHLPTRK